MPAFVKRLRLERAQRQLSSHTFNLVPQVKAGVQWRTLSSAQTICRERVILGLLVHKHNIHQGVIILNMRAMLAAC